MIFSVEKRGIRPYEFNDRIHHNISYEMSLNLKTADREVYHVLAWLGDMGGLFDGLKGLFALAVAILTYQRYDTYMVAQLFQQSTDDGKDG